MTKLRIQTLYKQTPDGWIGSRQLQQKKLFKWKIIDIEKIPDDLLNSTPADEKPAAWVSRFARYGNYGSDGVVNPLPDPEKVPARHQKADRLLFSFTHSISGILFGLMVCSSLSWSLSTLLPSVAGTSKGFQYLSGMLLISLALMTAGEQGDSTLTGLFRKAAFTATAGCFIIAGLLTALLT